VLIRGRRRIRAHAPEQVIPRRALPGLNRLHTLPHSFSGEFAQILTDRRSHFLPSLLFTNWDSNCQCVTHITYVTQTSTTVNPWSECILIRPPERGHSCPQRAPSADRFTYVLNHSCLGRCCGQECPRSGLHPNHCPGGYRVPRGC